MSFLGSTSRKTQDPEPVTFPFWVSVFLSVKWGDGLESAGGGMDGRAICSSTLNEEYRCSRSLEIRLERKSL